MYDWRKRNLFETYGVVSMKIRELLAQDQAKLRTRIIELMDGRSVLAMSQAIGISQTTLRRWLVLEKNLSTYAPLFKIIDYIEQREAEKKTVKGQTRMK